MPLSTDHSNALSKTSKRTPPVEEAAADVINPLFRSASSSRALGPARAPREAEAAGGAPGDAAAPPSAPPPARASWLTSPAFDTAGAEAFFFNAELRPGAHWFKVVELVLLACMGAAAYGWPTATPAQCAGKAAFSILVVSAVFFVVLLGRPYSALVAWTTPLKLFTQLLLAMMAALGLAADLRRGRELALVEGWEAVLPGDLDENFAMLASAVFGMSCVFLVLVPSCFAHAIYKIYVKKEPGAPKQPDDTPSIEDAPPGGTAPAEPPLAAADSEGGGGGGAPPPPAAEAPAVNRSARRIQRPSRVRT